MVDVKRELNSPPLLLTSSRVTPCLQKSSNNFTATSLDSFLFNDAKYYIKRCIQCQQTKKKSKTTTAEMQSVECPKSTWRKIAIDLVGPIMMRMNNINII
jgi:hypothetical protein